MVSSLVVHLIKSFLVCSKRKIQALNHKGGNKSMAIVYGGRSEILDFLKAWGIETNNVKSVTIHIPLDDSITVEVVKYAFPDDPDDLRLELEKYYLIKKDE